MRQGGDYKQAIMEIRMSSLNHTDYTTIKSICRKFKITNSLGTTLIKIGAMIKVGKRYIWKDTFVTLDEIAERCREYNRIHHKNTKNKNSGLDETTCINFLKSTGKYKIQTLTQTWTEI